MSPTSAPGVSVIFSTPTTSTILARFASMRLSPWWIAAEPVAQAFSTRVAGLKRNRSSAWMTSEAGKSWAENPWLKRPTYTASTSSGSTPASATASEATPQMRDSRSSPSSRPNFVCAQPAMQPVMSSPPYRGAAGAPPPVRAAAPESSPILHGARIAPSPAASSRRSRAVPRSQQSLDRAIEVARTGMTIGRVSGRWGPDPGGDGALFGWCGEPGTALPVSPPRPPRLPPPRLPAPT